MAVPYKAVPPFCGRWRHPVQEDDGFESYATAPLSD